MYRCLVALAAVWPLSAGAHPHVFVDVGLQFLFDDQARLTHVRVTWAYDDFYSLLILEDLDLDPDGDGALSDAEQARLTGFDTRWIAGYDGDLEMRIGDRRLSLSGPLQPTATAENGRIVTTHLRAVPEQPAATGGTFSARAYDETYYTAYEVNLPVTVTGASGCRIEARPPDIDARLDEMRAMLLRLNADADLEENDIPLIGAEFATEIRVSCPGS